MLDADSRREFDVVLFWSLDRLIKEGTLATLKYLELLTSYGVGYRSFTEAIRTASGRFGRQWWRYSGVSLGKSATAFLSEFLPVLPKLGRRVEQVAGRRSSCARPRLRSWRIRAQCGGDREAARL